jgi:hypothetical protein
MPAPRSVARLFLGRRLNLDFYLRHGLAGSRRRRGHLYGLLTTGRPRGRLGGLGLDAEFLGDRTPAVQFIAIGIGHGSVSRCSARNQ